MIDLKTCMDRAETAGWNEIDTLAHVVGSRFYGMQYGVREMGPNEVPLGRQNLEKIARQHLGTAAVAILQGVVYR
jgi:hypothetical protein